MHKTEALLQGQPGNVFANVQRLRRFTLRETVGFERARTVKHAIHLRGISASTHNNVKIIRSFIETIAKLLGIPNIK